MKNKFLIIITLFLHNYVFSHLCHDPFRPQQHLVLVPEKEQISIEETGKFRMYVENTFRSTLNDVRLIVESDAFDVEVEPYRIEELTPGERSFFLVKLKLRKGFKAGSYPLKINVDARSAELTPSIQKMDVVVEKKTELETTQLEEPKVLIEKPTLQIEEVKPKEAVLPKIALPEKKEPTKEVVKEVELQQKVVEPKEVEEIVVKVEKIPFWKKTYFYIILVLVLVLIFIWRKIK